MNLSNRFIHGSERVQQPPQSVIEYIGTANGKITMASADVLRRQFENELQRIIIQKGPESKEYAREFPKIMRETGVTMDNVRAIVPLKLLNASAVRAHRASA